MRMFLRVAVLTCGLLSVLASLAGSASASWTNSGDTSFSATTGPATLSGGSATLTCTSGRKTATAGVSATTTVWVNAEVGAVSFSGCRLAGLPVGVTCRYGFDAQYNALSGVTTGSMNLTAASGYGCTITGTSCLLNGTVANMTYTNPSGTTFGFNILPANSTLTLSGSGCILGSGSSTVTTMKYNITIATGGSSTPHQGPRITRP